MPLQPLTVQTDDRRPDAEREPSEGAAEALDQAALAIQAWVADTLALERTLRRTLAITHATASAAEARGLMAAFRAMPAPPRPLLAARTRAQRRRDALAGAAAGRALAREAAAEPCGLISTFGD